MGTLGTDNRVVQAKNALATAQGNVSNLEGKGFGPEYVPLKAARTELDNARRTLVAARRSVIQSIKNDYEAAVINERGVQDQLAQAKANQMDLDHKGVDYNKLQRQADTTRSIYNSLLTQQKELTVVANSKQNNVQVIEHADVPKVPYAPNPKREWLNAMMAGRGGVRPRVRDRIPRRHRQDPRDITGA
jgi:uncharacterized protein involved in exopolysaccharide biosynthesis